MQDNTIVSAVNQMIKTVRMHKQLIDSKVANICIHRTAHRILMHIAKNDRLESQKALAEHIGITPAAITGELKKLEKEGYIKRVHGNDNRYNTVEITDEGKKVVEETRTLFSEIDNAMFSDFTEEELETYIKALEKIQNNIKNNMQCITKEGSDKY